MRQHNQHPTTTQTKASTSKQSSCCKPANPANDLTKRESINMYPEQNSELSLNFPTRCISAVHGDKRHHRFIVGTCLTSTNQTKSTSSNTTATSPTSSPSSSTNQLFLVRYDEELSEVVIDAQLDHYTGEVWCLSACPLDKRLLVTCGGGGGITSSVLGNESSTVLWRFLEDVFPIEEDDEEEEDGTDSLDEYTPGGGRKHVDTLTAALRGAIDRGHESVRSMEEVCTLVHPDDRSTTLRGRISDIVWNPECWDSESKVNLESSFSHGSGCNMITVGHGSNIVTTWNIGASSALPIQRIDVSAASNPKPTNTTSMDKVQRRLIPTPPKAAWDPHNTNMIALSCGPDVVLYDLRSSQKSIGAIAPCHSLGVTALDYNPNKPHLLTTSGQEGFIKFWDLRISASSSSSSRSNALGIAALTPTDITSFQNYKRQAPPLKVVQGGHSHWVSAVQYNKSHDQLVLTGGTVGLVNLWRIHSLPLKPILDLEGKNEDNQNMSKSKGTNTKDDDSASVFTNADRKKEDMENTDIDQDVCVDTMELNDSVYSLAWSAADPWVYAALCYDGTVAVRSVPSKEKYKILL